MNANDGLTDRAARREDTRLIEHAEPVPGKRDRISVLWTRTLTLLFVVVLGLGALAFGSAVYQRSAFDQTTTQLESELNAAVQLTSRIRAVDVSMAAIIYEMGTPAQLEGQVRAFVQHHRKIELAFDRAEQYFPHRDKQAPLASARATWNKTANAVLAAQKFWGTPVVQDALASGEDPFAKEWELLKSTQANVTKLTAQSLSNLRARSAGINQVQQLIPPVVLGALVLVLVLGLWSGRRMSRRVVAPVVHLRNAAARMRDGDLQTTVHVDAAGAELKDLALAMNELASSLHTSHHMLRNQAYTCPVTGLANRKALVEHLTGRLEAAPAAGTSLLFIDLDDFKFVNDALGHDAGDQLLTIVAARLQSSARDNDLVARLGGDEFAVAVDEGHDPTPAITVAERILAALGEPIMIKDTPVTVGCSIGIALTGSDSVTAEDLLRNADMAMYMAKSGGKNRLELYSHTMHTEMVSRMNFRADLTHAVDREQLELHYQPVVDLTNEEILGWEALVRWHHPDRGFVSPGEFIPLAEESGDILTIGKWVLDRACEDFANTLAPGKGKCWLSVNVSAHQLLQPDFAQTVSEALDRWGVDAASLVLEITEAALVTDTEQAGAMLTRLQRDGVRIALDDFGTGFSSLRRLQELPVDIIKIDRSFVARTGSLHAAGMLEAIVTLGSTLGLDMIAEGIERRAELEHLKKLGGLAGQGYYFARPMPASHADTRARATVPSGWSRSQGRTQHEPLSTCTDLELPA